MNNMIKAVVVLCAVAVNAGAQVNFDQGLTLSDVVDLAVADAPQLPEAKSVGIPSYTTPDCKKVEFETASALEASFPLRSLEMYQDCQNFGAPVGQICTPRPEYHTANAKVALTELPALLPGQKEKFEICLNGPFLSLRQDKKNVYKYDIKREMETFRLTPKFGSAEKGFFSGDNSSDDVCRIAADNGHYCVYQCKDGSFISKPNPFPVIPAPNQWVGPIYTPCAPSIHNLPAVIDLRDL